MRFYLAVWFFAAASAYFPVEAGDLKVEGLAGGIPESVASGMRDVLKPDGFKALSGDKVLAKFWFRKEIPGVSGISGGLGVTFGQLIQGVFLGVVNLPTEWFDHKDRKVPPGVYTLRYGIQPTDGAHMGVSSYPDFLVLIPASADTDVNVVYDYDKLVEPSLKAAHTNHPATLALFPVTEEASQPKLVKNEMGQWTIAVQVGNLTIGLVMLGHGTT